MCGPPQIAKWAQAVMRSFAGESIATTAAPSPRDPHLDARILMWLTVARAVTDTLQATFHVHA